MNEYLYWIMLIIMIYVLFINQFIRRIRNIILYFNVTHYCVMRIASWVILSNTTVQSWRKSYVPCLALCR